MATQPSSASVPGPGDDPDTFAAVVPLGAPGSAARRRCPFRFRVLTRPWLHVPFYLGIAVYVAGAEWLIAQESAPSKAVAPAPGAAPSSPESSAPRIDLRGSGGFYTLLSGLLMWLVPLMISEWDKRRTERREERDRQDRLEKARQDREDRDLQRKYESTLAQLTDTRKRLLDVEERARQIDANAASTAFAIGKVDSVAKATATTRPTVRPGRPAPTVLIVEDTPSLAHAYAEVLTDNGFSTTHASTEDEALRLLNGSPHWVLLDLYLVQGSGVNVLREIRRRGLHCRVAVMTGMEEPTLLSEVKSLNPEHVLIKPISGDELLEKIRIDWPLSAAPDPPDTGPAEAPPPVGGDVLS